MGNEEINRLRWRCRRGMREIDVVLVRFLETGYAQASADDRSAFEELLTLPDVDILALLTGRAGSDDPAIRRALELVLGERLS